MSEKMQCPHCDAPIRTSAPISAGKKIRCPKCQEGFQPDNQAKPRAEQKVEKKATRPRPPVAGEDTPPAKKKVRAQPEEREEQEDFDEEERPARQRKKKKSKQGGKGKMIALVAGGGVVIVLAIVLGLGFALGWFGGSGSPGIAKPGPGPGPGSDPVKKEPSAAAQKVFDRITLNIREFTLAQLQKEFADNRSAGPAEVDALFAKVAFRERIFGDFQQKRNELKVKQWIFIEREGNIIVCGLSEFKDGQTRVSMLGHYNPGNAAYFNITGRGSGSDVK